MVSREEALNRADQDSGDGDETVWMKQTKKGRSRIYHDDPTCSYLSSASTVELSRHEAQNNGYGACKVCTLEIADRSSTGSRPTDLIETVRQKLADE
jgi:hypothetical protein